MSNYLNTTYFFTRFNNIIREINLGNPRFMVVNYSHSIDTLLETTQSHYLVMFYMS